MIKKPTPDEREALSSYFHLLSRLYPCGECAAEFQQLLKKYPPQVLIDLCHTLAWLTHINRPHRDLQLLHGKPPSSLHRIIHTQSLPRLCVVHNQVNERLKKPQFDCAHLDETYDCGCGDDTVTQSAPTRGVHDDPHIPEHVGREASIDADTGAELIKGGR
jgi:FAD-linked sulfhydryl oxidase